MPASPDPSWFDALSPTQQLIVNLLFFLVTAGGMAYGYFRRPAPAPSKDVVLTAAGFMDMNPVRDMVKAIEALTTEQARCADALESITSIMKVEAEHEVLERRVTELVNERVAAMAAAATEGVHLKPSKR